MQMDPLKQKLHTSYKLKGPMWSMKMLPLHTKAFPEERLPIAISSKVYQMSTLEQMTRPREGLQVQVKHLDK